MILQKKELPEGINKRTLENHKHHTCRTNGVVFVFFLQGQSTFSSLRGSSISFCIPAIQVTAVGCRNGFADRMKVNLGGDLRYVGVSANSGSWG